MALGAACILRGSRLAGTLTHLHRISMYRPFIYGPSASRRACRVTAKLSGRATHELTGAERFNIILNHIIAMQTSSRSRTEWEPTSLDK